MPRTGNNMSVHHERTSRQRVFTTDAVDAAAHMYDAAGSNECLVLNAQLLFMHARTREL